MKSRWLTAVDDERGTLRLEFNSGLAFLHLVLRMPLEGMRAAKRHLPEVKAWLRSVGHAKVYVIIPEGNEQLYRFERFFGFNEVLRSGGQIIMTQEC